MAKTHQSLNDFSVVSAKEAARAGCIDEWVNDYLLQGDWANIPMAEGLALQKRWWRGPVLLPLSQMQRVCGPEPEMEYQMNEDDWQRRTHAIATSLTTLEALPPLILVYESGELLVRDGNHRYGALEQAGYSACWVFIWYNTGEDYAAHQL